MRKTMKDVAVALGVSTSTVSRSLKGDRRISEATRHRVRREADRIGFLPDPGAANLVAHRWRREHHDGRLNIAFLHRPGSAEVRRDAAQFNASAKEAGFQLDRIKIEGLADWENLPRVLRARGVSGIILQMRILAEECAMASEVLSVYPAVFANVPQSVELAPVVMREPFYRVLDTIREVRSRGYKRIGILLPASSRSNDPMLERMRSAYLWGQQENVPGHEMLLHSYSGDMGWPEWLAPDLCECVIGFDDNIGRHLESRWSVPGQLAFASMATEEPRFAGIGNTVETVIRDAVELLGVMIQAGRPGSALARLHHEVRGQWRDGPSCP